MTRLNNEAGKTQGTTGTSAGGTLGVKEVLV